MIKYIITLFLLCFTFFSQFAYSDDYFNTMLQPEQVHEDLEQWITFLDKTHPQLSYTVKDVDGFYRDVESLKNSIKQPISVLDFWKKVSLFNSTLNDGHTVINVAKLTTRSNEYIQSGGALFPFEVIFDGDKVIIKSQTNGVATPFRGAEITAINGQNIADFVAPLLARTNGDSEQFRKALLQRRFAQYIWLYYGEFDEFTLALDKYGQKQTKVVKASNTELNVDDVFSDKFKFEILDKNNALLTLNSFNWGAKYKDVVSFIHNAFAQLEKHQIEHLIIDIRQNGGGDDAIWIDGILPYVADKTWRTGSNNKFKILEGRARKDYKVGDVIESENSFREVDTSVKKFKGDVSVLISPFTYSSSILFANVMQDHQFGQLVGESTGGKSGQTGGTQAIALKHSKLRAISPFFYLARPKGGENHSPVVPDIAINYDKTIPEQLVNKLINQRNVSAL